MLSERIKQERIRLSMTQAAIAEMIGVSSDSWFGWEKGKATPNIKALEAMADLGVDVLYVVTGVRSKPVQESLSPEELALIDNYRNATNEGRQAARTVLFAVSKLREAA